MGNAITASVVSMGLMMGLISCTKHNPAACLDNGFCTDPSRPFCDVGGEVAGAPGTCIAVSCASGQFEACRGESEVRCNDTGDNYDVVQCQAGCGTVGCNACRPNNDFCDGFDLRHCGADGKPAGAETCAGSCETTPSAHCGYLEPRYLPTVCDTMATTPSLAISTTTTLDTSLGNCTSVVAQTNGPEICVFHFGTISISRTGVVSVIGSRALALVADGALDIDGQVFAGADGAISGPGGGFLTSGGDQAGTVSGTPSLGGGGAGFKFAGAAGGSNVANGGAVNGGAAIAEPNDLPILVGGPTPEATGPKGGGGGGAVDLISCRGTVSIRGTIAAPGGGGNGGLNDIANGKRSAGMGGGAGGNIIIEGMQLFVNGQLSATGGGGGAGTGVNGLNGGDGLNGTPADFGGTGGSSSDGGGHGGFGGGGTCPGFTCAPSVGSMPSAGGNAGGGGGSMGFVQTFAPQGVVPFIMPKLASPQPQAHRAAKLR